MLGALVAMAALVTLPGLVVVRSPWRAMPALSVAFWVLTWTWMPHLPRTRLLQAALVAFGTLSLLRVLRPGPLPRLRPAHVALAAAVLAAGLALSRPPVPRGTSLPVDALAAELLVWRDAWPVSFEPLVALRPFRASALAMLGADAALLSRAEPHRAATAAVVAAALLLVLAWWSVAECACGPARAAAITMAATLVSIAGNDAGAGTLGAALALEAVVLWLDRRGRPSAFASGACAAAALTADAMTAAGVLLAAVLVVRATGVTAADARGRLRMAATTALVLSAPLAWRWSLQSPSAAMGPLMATALLVALCALWGPQRRAGLGRAAATAALVLAAATLSSTHGATEAARGPSADDVRAMTWVRAHSRPDDVVCSADVPAARWIPALAGRASSVPVRSGWPAASAPCRVWLDLSTGAAAPRPPGAAAFRSASSAAWTTYQDR